MKLTRVLFVASQLALALTHVTPAFAANEPTTIGADTYLAAPSPVLTADVTRDAFVTGFSTRTETAIAGDLHLAGFSVDANGPVDGDLYAVGADITIASAINEDATIAGFSVLLESQAAVRGNLRLAAGTATVNSPVIGSLVATAGELRLNSHIKGDVLLASAQIRFGPEAKIDGYLDYAAPDELVIPSSVINPDRVRYSPVAASDFGELGRTIDESASALWPSLLTMASGFAVTLIFLMLVAALFIAFAPAMVSRLRRRAQSGLGKSVLLGFLGLSTLVGLIPVSIITLVGIPLIPLVLLAIALAWMLGYLLGLYALAMRVAEAFRGQPESPAGKLLTLAVGLLLAALINFIPIAGWLINLAVVFLGLGAISWDLCLRLIRQGSGDDE